MQTSKMFAVVLVVGIALSLAGCGEPPPDEHVQSSVVRGTPPNGYQTVAGHNTAVTSAPYSCNGWSYRVLYSLEQHRDLSGPDAWYAAVGPSSVGATGVVTDFNGNLDVSADVYLQCFSGIIPTHFSGTLPSGKAYNEIYADYRSSPLECTLTTVWPASWHAPNPVLPVHLLQYDWNASIVVDSPGGTIFLDIDVDAGYQSAPGNGFCGRKWLGGGITEAAKFVRPAPPAYTCTGDPYTDYVEHGTCYAPPPDCTLAGNGPCPPPPDAT